MVDRFYKVVTEQGLILPHDRVVVGLSGGADSVCLLYLCTKLGERLPISLSAAHVNHGLREEADREAEFCRELCSKWQVPLFETKGCARQAGKNTEAVGRALRYDFFDSLKADKVALAHHKNDQAETVLMHLLRGCGTEGLGGMAPQRGKYIRPLLHVTRAEIEAFCREEGLAFCTDQSNFSTEYTRNRLRLEVIPLLEEINPRAVDALCRTANLVREDVHQLERDTQKIGIFHPFEDGFYCNRQEFFQLSPALQRRCVRGCWETLTGEKTDLWFAPVEAALQLFSQGKTRKKILLGKEIWAENCYEELLIAREKAPLSFQISLKAGERMQIPNTNLVATARVGKPKQTDTWVFDSYKVRSEITIRSRKDGDVFYQNGMHKKLKKLFIDQKIPVRIRNQAIVVECDNEVIGVSGLGVAEGYRGKEGDCLIVNLERMKRNDIGQNGGEGTVD